MSAVARNGGIRYLRQHRRVGLGIAVVTASALMVPLVGASAASAFSEGDFRGTRVTGRAWGAEARLSHSLLPNLSLGKLARQSLPCKPPAESYNTVLTTTSLPGTGALVRLGVVENRGVSTATTTEASVTETSRILDVNLLDGLIRAQAVEARARTTINAGGRTNDGDVNLVELYVGTEKVVLVEGQANVSIDLLGGNVRVVINEQITSGRKFQVNAIHVYVRDFLGYNGDIVVAHAETSLAKAPGHLSGYAYLSFVRIKVGTTAHPLIRALSGRQNEVVLPCGGGSKSSDALRLVIPDGNGGHILSSATSRSTVDGTMDSNGGESTSTHTLEKLSLLNGRITADALITRAHTETTANDDVRSTGSVQLLNLRIDGVLKATLDANVKVNLPGIGFIVINKQVCNDDETDNSPCVGEHYNEITVYALQIVVDTLNSLLPIDANIIVGAAHSDVNF